MKKLIKRVFLLALLAGSFTACEAVYDTPSNANGENSSDTSSTTEPPNIEIPIGG